MGDSNNNNNPEKVLEEFRNAWKQEVQKKHVQPESSSTKSAAEQQTVTEEKSVTDLIDKTEALTTQQTPVTAMDHYIIAVDHERQGKLGQGKKI